MRPEAHAAAEMALGLRVIVPVLLGDRGVGPLNAVFAVVAGRLARLWRLFPILGMIGIPVLTFEENVPSPVR